MAAACINSDWYVFAPGMNTCLILIIPRVYVPRIGYFLKINSYLFMSSRYVFASGVSTGLILIITMAYGPRLPTFSHHEFIPALGSDRRDVGVNFHPW